MTGHEADGGLPRVDIVRGTPDDEDLAAIAAVLPLAYVEEAAHATIDDPPERSTWNHARRLRRTPGRHWGRFSG